MYQKKAAVIFIIALLCLCTFPLYADEKENQREEIIKKLRDMGLSDSQVDDVLTIIDEDKEKEHIEKVKEEDNSVTEVEDDRTMTLPEIVVSGEAERYTDLYSAPIQEKVNLSTPDSAKLLQKVPGTDIGSNGPISGIPIRRGQSYSSGRVNLLVDGMYIAPSCSNFMDPPLSHISPTELDSLKVSRGIASVSSGIETFAGSIEAKTKRGDFSEDKDIEFHGDVAVGVNTNNDAGYGHIFSHLSNKYNNLRFSATKEDGDDIEFDDGEIHPTEYERDSVKAGYSFSYGDHELGIDFQDSDEDDTGTPSLPMDATSVQSEITRVYYQGKIGQVDIEAAYYDTDIDHIMDNFTLRNVPATRQRFADTEVKGNGYTSHFTFNPLSNIEWKLGFDGDKAEHNAIIRSPASPSFFVTNFHDASKDRYSGFSETVIDLTDWFIMELGLRYNHIEMDSDRVGSTMAAVNPAVRTLTERFNDSSRDTVDNEVDSVLKFEIFPTPELTLGFGMARKTRTPTYQERYLYLPLESTAGLADGKRYVGKIDLDTETNYKTELNISFDNGKFYVRPNFFYSRVSNYIQGVPATDPLVIMISTMNGDPSPLQFDNISAKYFGFDGDWGVELHKYFRLDGICNYVRGKRRGSKEDDLYRIPPFNATHALTFHRDNYSLSLETVSYARQRKTSAFNDEKRTAGYTFLNFGGSIEPVKNLTISAGVENIFDKFYRIHLNGLNRVVNSDVEVGARLPGMGRNYYLSLRYTW
jgi:iron complex outermembrane receptor protein